MRNVDFATGKEIKKAIKRGCLVRSIYGGREWRVVSCRAVPSVKNVKLLAVEPPNDIVTISYDEFDELYKPIMSDDDDD